MENDGMTTYEQMVSEFNKLTFPEKLKESAMIMERLHFAESGYYSSAVAYDGYVEKREEFAANGDGGDYYVYLWKHIDGEIFYVGSGKNDRWLDRFRKSPFLSEIDKGDAVVYKVIKNLNKSDSLFWESYISRALSAAGVRLTNADNISRKAEDFEQFCGENETKLSTPFKKTVENVMVNEIMTDCKFSRKTYLKTEAFIERYGEHYFSERFGNKGEHEPILEREEK